MFIQALLIKLLERSLANQLCAYKISRNEESNMQNQVILKKTVSDFVKILYTQGMRFCVSDKGWLNRTNIASI